jgi:hypothetical protein
MFEDVLWILINDTINNSSGLCCIYTFRNGDAELRHLSDKECMYSAHHLSGQLLQLLTEELIVQNVVMDIMDQCLEKV